MTKENETIPSGFQFEKDVFGTCLSLKGRPETVPYVSFKEALREAVELSVVDGWNSSSPPPDLLISPLLDAIRSRISEKKLPYLVRVYPTVGTRLDHIHGVDGFFEARYEEHEFEKGPRATFVFDLSLYHSKRIKPEISLFKRRAFAEDLEKNTKFIVRSFAQSLSRQIANMDDS